MLGEVHPLLYTTMFGNYTSTVTSKKKSLKRYFEVKGMRIYMYLNFASMHYSLGTDRADFSAYEKTSAIKAGLYFILHVVPINNLCFIYCTECLQLHKDIFPDDCKSY